MGRFGSLLDELAIFCREQWDRVQYLEGILKAFADAQGTTRTEECQALKDLMAEVQSIRKP